MRPQQNRRVSNNSRRSNNNGALRRMPNPLTRNYESSGPEVKIRGNAQHIADKYLALARDAQASGDRIMGENYLQHAEHYTRIILSAQSHENNSRAGRGENEPYKGEERNAAAADADDHAPQPVIDGMPGEVTLISRNGGYAADAENEGRDSEQRQPRRRLPPRHERGQMRRPADNGADKANGAYSAAAAEGDDYAEAPQPERGFAGAAEDNGDSENAARRPARPRRPRRVKPETERTENL